MSLKISEAAEILNVHPQTLRRWEKEGKIEPVRINGQRKYSMPDIQRIKNGDDGSEIRKINVIYCRVSSRKQEKDLKRQVKFMQKIYPNDEVITDIGSGINFKRPGLQTLLQRLCKGEIGRISCSYKDRLARVGYDLLKQISTIFGCELVIINNIKTSPEEELVEDLIAITTSFSARMHGLRKYADQMSNDKTSSEGETGENMERVGDDIGENI